MDIEAPISQVTVFTDRAQVTRRASVQLQAGVQELNITGLPARLDENSLRASGSGSVAVKIVSVESHRRPLEKAPHSEMRDVQNELEAAQDEGAQIQKRAELLNQREKTVRELADNAAKRFARGLAEGTASLDTATQLLDFVDAQSRQINEQRATLKIEERANAEKQVMLGQRLKQFQGERQRSDIFVTVAVESEGVGSFDLEVSYTVPEASWLPLYDARVQLTPPASPDGILEGKLALTYIGTIFQRTGEDWNDVAITLSTAQPSLGTLPPKLEPLYINASRPAYAAASQKHRSSRSMVMGHSIEPTADEDFVDSLMEMVDASRVPAAASAPVPMAATHELAIAQIIGGTVTFDLPRRLSVPADGEVHRGTIAHHEFPVRLDHQAVPRRAALAYLRATGINDSGLSLLAGNVNVFRDGAFVGTASLEVAVPGQEFTLFLGPDEQVRAKRELVRREVDKNFIGNVRRQNYGFKIEVENLKPHRVELTVLDQIPVSKHEQIKVKPHFKDPQPETDDLGVMTWKLPLPAGAKRELHSDYVVECPREMALAGLTD